MIARIGVLILAVLSPVAAQQQTKNVEDYLPLAVGNSWTYEQVVLDARMNLDGSHLNPSTTDPVEQFTISILSTEVIDGETYYVFSEVPGTLVYDVPDHFIGGKKLRWNGNHLTEHDGTSELSLYRFDMPTSPENWIENSYSIPTTEGDTLVVARSWMMPNSGLLDQSFTFYGYTGYVSEGGWDAGTKIKYQWVRGHIFAEKWGLWFSSESLRDDDHGPYQNVLSPVRATFYTDTQGGTDTRSADGDSPSGTTYEYDAYRCARDGKPDCGFPTSQSSASWGAVKNGDYR